MFDRLQARLRRLFRVSTVPFDGFRLIGYRRGVPKGMIHALLAGDYERPERRAVKEVVRPGDRVVDIGACLGVVSLTAARIVGADNIVAFEPNPWAAAVATANFALNGLPVALERAAVGAAAGIATLAIDRRSWLGASLGGSLERRVEVPVLSIASVITAHRPTVLVLDAEGMEAEILPACPMHDLKAVVVEFHRSALGPEAVGKLQQLLAAQGFHRDARLSTSGETVSTDVWTRSPHTTTT